MIIIRLINIEIMKIPVLSLPFLYLEDGIQSYILFENFSGILYNPHLRACRSCIWPTNYHLEDFFRSSSLVCIDRGLWD